MKISFLKTITIALFSTGLYTACTSDSVSPTTQEGIKITNVPARFASQTSSFAFDFLKQANTTEKGKNVFVSPLSLHMALGMLLNGADKNTAEQIKTTLGAKDISLDELNKTYLALMKGLPAVDPNVGIGIANSTWQKSTSTPEAAFGNTLKEFFLSDAYTFDTNNPEEAKTKINEWVASKTGGRIKEMVDQVPSNIYMYLLNAVYFNGKWKYAFDSKLTSDYNFEMDGSKSKTVKMMTQQTKLRATQGSNYAAYEMPYSNGSYNMTVVIPDRGTDIDAFVKNFGVAEWNILQSRLVSASNIFGIPRLELNYDAKLNETLKAMGIKDAFVPGLADLSKISKINKLYVGDVKQKTFLKVDEAGTEASAATSIEIRELSASARDYIANRPFLIFISENSSNTILFTGKIVNP
jgi:serine protease inhibitor